MITRFWYKSSVCQPNKFNEFLSKKIFILLSLSLIEQLKYLSLTKLTSISDIFFIKAFLSNINIKGVFSKGYR